MKFILIIFLILTPSPYVVQCDVPAGQNQEFDLDGFEKITVSDQNQDATMFGNGENFGNQDKGNFFMDMYSIQTGPKQVEFGHVFEDPDTWEQRYEKKDHENKRFQGYQHVPKKDHYDFAYKRGNEHHVKEHHEKAAPHEGHFKIQARWGDKHGGYGEHYWDYNHGGDSHDEGSANEEINAEYSRNVQSPSVMPPTAVIEQQSTESINHYGSEPKSIYHKHQKSSKYAKKPKYEEIRNRHPSKYDKSTDAVSTVFESSTDSNIFIIPPKSLAHSTSVNSFEDKPELSSSVASSRGASDISHGNGHIDLYDQLKNMPNVYNQFEEMYATAPAIKLSTKFLAEEQPHYAH